MIVLGAIIGAVLVAVLFFLKHTIWIWIGGIALLGVSVACFGHVLNASAYREILLGVAVMTLFGAAVGTPVRLFQITIEDGPRALARKVLVAVLGALIGIVLLAGVIWLGIGK